MEKKINLADLERENECLRKQLAELDELPSMKKLAGKGVAKLKGVQDIPTNVGKKIHAAPRRQGDRDYLDLYLLQKERDRLVKETALVKKRRLQLGMKVSIVDEEMAEKQANVLQDMTILSADSHKKPVKGKTPGKKLEAPKSYEYKEDEWNKFTLEY